MSFSPKISQNVYKMSACRSNGLADDSFVQNPSATSSAKAACNSPNPQAIVEEPFVRKICPGNVCAQGVGMKTPLTSEQSCQRRNTLETSSHIVREVGRAVNHMLSYEEEALDKIEKITKDIEKMYKEMEKVERFEQISEYKKFEEFFLQKNIELDNVDPKNNDQVREFRKAAVRYVQDCMYNLDQKQKISVKM